ncbi:cytochrome c3 family protein [Desulfurobacterium thermolithotrophum]|uniref:cytochrome c3 family protein n=1 Tax=Desulfurobacterium thermolithotrophum TaxID=64160 RepID=UPI0013D1B0CE|nr:NapC/NirT family cytochrome c [Desulfurobacterium thermolithotrophum]
MEKDRKKLLISGIAGLAVVGAAVFVSAQIIKATNQPSFCGSCHEMKPMVETWKESSHFGRASCVDCHLPHDNIFNYLAVKAKSGIKDFVGHVFHEGYMNDPEHWIEKRKEREHYVFVSNCKRCHSVLPDNFFHRQLQRGEIQGDCLTCHWDVGHGPSLEMKIGEFFGEEETVSPTTSPEDSSNLKNVNVWESDCAKCHNGQAASSEKELKEKFKTPEAFVKAAKESKHPLMAPYKNNEESLRKAAEEIYEN